MTVDAKFVFQDAGVVSTKSPKNKSAPQKNHLFWAFFGHETSFLQYAGVRGPIDNQPRRLILKQTIRNPHTAQADFG